ncbi:MAG: winged helix-turn-helix transcriptional regulator [Bacteroidales bacterium]|nr:winged helix-turn-helix transcriptional regulator [Bacteroidales bacterium]
MYEIVGNGLRVRFKALESALIDDTEAEENSGGDVHTQKGVEKSVEKIIRAIKENPQITVKELTTLIGLSRRGVEKNIKNLKQKGIIRRVGPDKGDHWEVIPQK